MPREIRAFEYSIRLRVLSSSALGATQQMNRLVENLPLPEKIKILQVIQELGLSEIETTEVTEVFEVTEPLRSASPREKHLDEDTVLQLKKDMGLMEEKALETSTSLNDLKGE